MIAQKDVHVAFGKEDEADLFDCLVSAEEVCYRARGDGRRLLARVAVGARRDRREGHARERVRRGQRQRVAVGGRQQLGLAPAENRAAENGSNDE